MLLWWRSIYKAALFVFWYRITDQTTPLHPLAGLITSTDCGNTESRASSNGNIVCASPPTGNIAHVDYDSIAGKVARIRAELKQIRAENRLYFAKKHHTEDEMMQHRKRKDRVLEIRAELEAILKRKSA